MGKYLISTKSYDEKAKKYVSQVFEVEADDFYVADSGPVVFTLDNASGYSVQQIAAFYDWVQVALAEAKGESDAK